MIKFRIIKENEEVKKSFETEEEFWAALKQGFMVEMEHRESVSGDFITIAKIAMDHLKSMPNYYTELKKIEEPFVPNNELKEEPKAEVKEEPKAEVKEEPKPEEKKEEEVIVDTEGVVVGEDEENKKPEMKT